MYCSLLIAQKAQQNRRGQIKGNEIRGRNLGMFGVKKRKKKSRAAKHWQEASTADCGRDVQKRGWEKAEKSV